MPESSYVAFPDLCGTVLYLTNVVSQTEELKMKNAKCLILFYEHYSSRSRI